MGRRIVTCLIVAFALLAVSCGNADLKPKVTPDPRILPSNDPKTQTQGATGGQELEGVLSVYASTPLRDAITALQKGFIAANPKATVNVVFDGTEPIVKRVKGDVEADVIVLDAVASMDKLTDKISDRPQTVGQVEGTGVVQVAALKRTAVLAVAQGFVGYAKSKDGQTILQAHGFKPA